MAQQTFEAWREPKDGSISFGSRASFRQQRAKGLLTKRAKLLYAFRAATWEEASAVHHLRMGWEPYKPMGEPAKCGKCKAVYFPEGSGECWGCEAKR